MRILWQLLRAVSGRVEDRTNRPQTMGSDKADTRRRVAVARAQAKDYEALGWR